MGLLALSVSIFAAVIGEPPDDTTLRNLGRLLLALLLLWAYLDFMQVLIVWQSDLPNEAPWYIVRSRGGWGFTAALVAEAISFYPSLPYCRLGCNDHGGGRLRHRTADT
jgi:hypothetical protein